jgi:diguanylate cyclase (GGDEF)-like protein
MCDIDHFKKINDCHGHQAGDEALVVFSSLLQRHARAADLVARYGGEEFVILCADCNNATATQRAEEMRRNISETPLPSLGNACITASFGVTEIQEGDTPATFLRRVDRALLQAKDSGRNTVIQLGSGIPESHHRDASSGGFSWFRRAPSETLLERSLLAVVPIAVLVEKLRGFVADHQAEILSTEESGVVLKIDGQNTPLLRRSSDRAVPFVIELRFQEKVSTPDADARTSRKPPPSVGTLVHVVVRPKRQRDRRRRDAVERARQLLVSLKSYLMAHEFTEANRQAAEKPAENGFVERARRILSLKLGK